MTVPRRKLIEVSLPLDAINREAAREKSIRHGHPSTLHLWWARRPLAACRAVLFAQLVDDPSARPEEFPTEEAQAAERARLHALIERLVPWEATTDVGGVLAEARAEIRKSCGDDPPAVLDPFAGGGSIPLEAQRLGLVAHASDLNPVAVLINKALIEIPPRFAGRPPVHPDAANRTTWTGAQGLAEDVRFYGRWMRDEAQRRIGHLYPKATLPDGTQANVIAWIWARTVTCPNPACGGALPLVRSFWLGKKKGKEAWVRPVVEGGRVRFEIGHGPGGPPVEGTVSRTGATCIVCSTPVPLAHVRAEGKAGRMGAQLMAVVAEGHRQRIYLAPTVEHEQAAVVARPDAVPDTELPKQALGFRVQGYGMTHHADLFTSRQLVALCTFSDLVGEARALVEKEGGPEYADAVAVYLSLAVSRLADLQNSLARWENSRSQVRNLFTRQAISMIWDFGECGLFSEAAGDFKIALKNMVTALEGTPRAGRALVLQRDAATHTSIDPVVISTDPPYYDNIGYADLADFFYVWLRRSLKEVYPELLATVLTPKASELVADPFRHEGGKDAAERFFEDGFVRTFTALRAAQAPGIPLTVFYAFKQAEDDDDGVASTGWETMLAGLIAAGLEVTATWPMRTELGNRMRNQASNALASSIVLACRPRPDAAGVTDKRAFVAALRAELPSRLRLMQQAAVAPVDLAQAAIGPGMAVFSRYAKVIEPSGEPMRVRAALVLINEVLAEVLDEQEGELDAESRWAVKWFEQYRFDAGDSGLADQLCRAYDTSLGGLVEAGVISAVAPDAAAGTPRAARPLGPGDRQPCPGVGGHPAPGEAPGRTGRGGRRRPARPPRRRGRRRPASGLPPLLDLRTQRLAQRWRPVQRPGRGMDGPPTPSQRHRHLAGPGNHRRRTGKDAGVTWP